MTGGVLKRVLAGPVDPDRRLRVARIDGTTEVTLGDLHERAGRIARWLLDRGVGPGDRVGILARNSLEWVALDLASLRVGAVVAGLEPDKFVHDPEFAHRYGLGLVVSDRPDVRDAVPIEEVRRAAGSVPATRPPAPVEWGARDTPALKFTSGSTGVPKALAASAGSIESSLAAVQDMFGHGPGDDLFVFLPLSLLQQRYWIYSALAFGHDVTVSTYEAAYAAVGGCRPTVVMGVPGFYETARHQIERRAARVGGDPRTARRSAARAILGDRIRYLWTGSAPAATSVLDFFEECGLAIYEGYGLNETCIVSKNCPQAHRKGSVGRVLPGKRVEIDPDGVIVVHMAHPVAESYLYAEPGASDRVFGPGGAVRTGDVGYLDDEGFLHVQGRADDILVLGNGRKVNVRPIEENLRSESCVQECVVYCPDETELVAVVSPAEGARSTDVATALAVANSRSRPDEWISRAVLAHESFTVQNELLTSQFKPRRNRIHDVYRTEIHDRKEGVHAA
ncbi:AMP-binding protein [Halostreptopolyspora alba]|uniref:AMP-dependent synthetase n=1 Tax=Halostreptopolyspora alba TaxID=2487137 RepID=A0A3N0EII6_9ACTN|nr:AMP-dependent synthetase [Nocardiopsaceae bacterium YIM 96095]